MYHNKTAILPELKRNKVRYILGLNLRKVKKKKKADSNPVEAAKTNYI